MRRLTILILLMICLAGCAYEVPRKYLPPPVSNDSFSDPVKTVAIPLPVIGSSPNEGVTGGGLVAFLLHNSKNEVSSLVVPQENYNKYFGVSSILYGAFYPTPTKNIKVNLAKATTINEEMRLRYEDKRLFSDRFEGFLHLFNYKDGSARFFGFQSSSLKANETNYTDAEFGFLGTLGYRLTDHFELLFTEQLKRVNIEQGAVTSIPFITQRFPPSTVPGVYGYGLHAQQVALAFNTLDSEGMPTTGTYIKVSFEESAKWMGSNADFQAYLFEAKHYFPLAEGRFVTVPRFACKQTVGKEIPFLEQAILGGETTLRGYGQNRFIDKSYLLLNLEERIRLFRWEIFKVTADWELAPFVDFGSVMHSLVEATGKTFEFNPGIGLRTVVRPNIVGRIDVGVGKDGPAVFVGLNYPF
ncbi:BamA/TamA family outer membrane protein [Geomonas sp.]|uniref:BamA/TamA family outer membrane protein n=1 Tax=Geomonas sp. TaxID=2651584 RepID=UPI002B4945B6|nr:BamA/TamA family outer membrane protein [Geomonas sp.]HJV34488.1 BamA/TamA family outer membrane protein [Geomonas sp.]